jgi:YggT family protein
VFSVFAIAIQFVSFLAQALVAAIILRAIFSWFMPAGSDNAIMRFLRDVTEPMLAPLRRVLPSMGMLDLSPFVAIILIQYVFAPILLSVLRTAAFAMLR